MPCSFFFPSRDSRSNQWRLVVEKNITYHLKHNARKSWNKSTRPVPSRGLDPWWARSTTTKDPDEFALSMPYLPKSKGSIISYPVWASYTSSSLGPLHPTHTLLHHRHRPNTTSRMRWSKPMKHKTAECVLACLVKSNYFVFASLFSLFIFLYDFIFWDTDTNINIDIDININTDIKIIIDIGYFEKVIYHDTFRCWLINFFYHR